MPKIRAEKKTRQHTAVSQQGITFNKDFGQHILKNPMIVQGIVEKVRARSSAQGILCHRPLVYAHYAEDDSDCPPVAGCAALYRHGA